MIGVCTSAGVLSHLLSVLPRGHPLYIWCIPHKAAQLPAAGRGVQLQNCSGLLSAAEPTEAAALSGFWYRMPGHRHDKHE